MNATKNIKTMTVQELESFGDELAMHLVNESIYDVETVMQNLNVLEIVLGLHHLFDMSETKVFFDQNNQSVVHQLLSSKGDNVPMDWDMGGALGRALTYAKVQGGLHFVIINDYALNQGSTYEALLEIRRHMPNLVIIMLDEQESLLRHYTSLDALIKNIRISKTYSSFKSDLREALDHPVSRPLLGTLSWLKDQVKETVLEPSIFTHFGLDYHGPIDGQNLKEVIQVLSLSQKFKGPHVIHVQTRIKSKQKRKLEFPRFKLDMDRPKGYFTYLEHLDHYLLQHAPTELYVLSDGLSMSEHLIHFAQQRPRHYLTVNGSIHAMVDMAKGLTLEKHPVLILVSAKRFSEVALQMKKYFSKEEISVMIIVYEAGLARHDRLVHNAVHDMVSYLYFDEKKVWMPRNVSDMYGILNYHIKEKQALSIMRLPQILAQKQALNQDFKPSWEMVLDSENTEGVILTFGPSVEQMYQKIKINNIPYSLIDTKTFNYVDEELFEKISEKGVPVLIYNVEGDYDLLTQKMREKMQETGQNFPLLTMNLAGVDYDLQSKELKNSAQIHIEDALRALKEATEC